MQKQKKQAFFYNILFSRMHGFTLIELMMTIAVLSVVAAAAIPVFTDMVSRNQQSAEYSSMKSFLQNARKQAISRRSYVTICARKPSTPGFTNEPAECYASPGNTYDENDNPWRNGWAMHISRDALNINDSDHIIKSQDSIQSTVTLSGNYAYIRFSPHGESFPAGTTITFCPSRVTGTVYAQEIILSNGRIRTQKNQTLCPQ